MDMVVESDLAVKGPVPTSRVPEIVPLPTPWRRQLRLARQTLARRAEMRARVRKPFRGSDAGRNDGRISFGVEMRLRLQQPRVLGDA